MACSLTGHEDFIQSFLLINLPVKDLRTLTFMMTVIDGCLTHRLSINRPTKRGKEKSPTRQCEKKIDDHLVACPQLFE
jgi:hypothetical protein